MRHSSMTLVALAMADRAAGRRGAGSAQAARDRGRHQRLQTTPAKSPALLPTCAIATRARRFAQPRLEELRDEATYLKVKLRKETGVSGRNMSIC